MVIQRIQSLYLLAAAVMMGFFCNSSLATVRAEEAVAEIRPVDYPVFLVINFVIALLLFLAIFMFKNSRRQKTVTLLSMVLMAASAVTGGFILYGGGAAAEIELSGGIVLLLCSLIMALGAYRGISRDERLLRDSDRIR